MRGRKALRLKLPQLDGYTLQETADRYKFKIGAIELGNPNAPMQTLIAGPVGQDALIKTPVANQRWQEFLYEIASECVKLFALRRRNGDGVAPRKMSLFASLRLALGLWTSAMQELHGDDRWRVRAMHVGASRIADALADAGELSKGHVRIVPTFHESSHRFVDTDGTDFQTTLSIRYPMRCNTKKSELNAAACHSMLESGTAALLDQLECVDAWVRNFRLGWSVPYMAANGAWRRYEPDFAVRLKQSESSCPLYLMVECKGVKDDDAMRKERYVRDWWVPAVNDSKEFEGRWRYCMVTDIRNAGAEIRNAAVELQKQTGDR